MTTTSAAKERRLSGLKAAAKKTAVKKPVNKTAPKAPAKKAKAPATKTAPTTPVKRTRAYTMNPKTATNHVHRNLIRYRRDPLTPEYVGFNLDESDQFAREVKSYLADKSELSTATLDAADYDELLIHFRQLADWKPKKAKKATVRKPGAAVKAATAALEKMNVRIEDTPAVPAARDKSVKVTVKVSVPPPGTNKHDFETPSRENRRVPQNWRDMCTEADTESARAWWKNWCDRRMRGEV